MCPPCSAAVGSWGAGGHILGTSSGACEKQVGRAPSFCHGIVSETWKDIGEMEIARRGGAFGIYFSILIFFNAKESKMIACLVIPSGQCREVALEAGGGGGSRGGLDPEARSGSGPPPLPPGSHSIPTLAHALWPRCAPAPPVLSSLLLPFPCVLKMRSSVILLSRKSSVGKLPRAAQSSHPCRG